MITFPLSLPMFPLCPFSDVLIDTHQFASLPYPPTLPIVPPLPSSIGSKHWQYAPPPISVSSWLVEIALLTYKRVSSSYSLFSYQSLWLSSWPLSYALDCAVTFYFSLFSERPHKKGWCPFCIKKIYRSKQSLSESPGVRPQQQGEARGDGRTRAKKWQND